jgi:hypothetical protein
MARHSTRVNLEPGFFGDRRTARLQHKMRESMGDIDLWDRSRFLATGIMAELWRNSQSEGVTEASRDQIDDWLYRGATEHLLASGYIAASGELFHICGNKEQIEGLKKWFDGKSAGGHASAKVRHGGGAAQKNCDKIEQNEKKPNDFLTEVNRTEQKLTEVNSIQYNTRQYNTIQNKEEKTPPASAKRQRAPRLKFEQEDLDLALDWIGWAHESEPHLKLRTETIADAIRKAREYAERDHKQMQNIFEWIKQDDFWQKNCLSPASLLNTSKNGVKKIDNVLASISRDKGYVARLQMNEWEEEGIKPLF